MGGEIVRYREAVALLTKFDAFMVRRETARTTAIKVEITFKVPQVGSYSHYTDDLIWAPLNEAAKGVIGQGLTMMLTEHRAALVAKIARLHAEAVKEAAAIITEELPT